MSEQQPITEETKGTFTETFEVAGNQVLKVVKDLVRQGNVRRVIIRNSENKVLIDTTLTVGAGAAGVLALIGALPLAVVGGVALGVFGRLKIEIIRELEDGDVLKDKSDKHKIEIAED